MNYEKVGFKCGLEIHQQLDSHKLFCNCPSVLRSDSPDFEVKRKLHSVAGEKGEVDVAVKHEAELDKEFIYQGYDSTCLVEIDEEPPHKLNPEALKIALEIAILLNCKIVPISQVMRKTVIDGSNTSGFQRTVMIARDGFIETSYGKVGIETVFLEEDSARRINSSASNKENLNEETISKDEKKVVYRLDRLGIPLVEIATAPDIKNAKQVKEAALKIGEILRSCKVKRGIGTIRQDINVSIKGTNRVEIKGFQDPKIMEVCVEKEVLRQQEFLDKKEKNPSEVRNCLPDGSTKFLRPMPGASRMYPETDLPLLKISRDLINSVKKTLPELKGDIEEDLRRKGLNNDMIKVLFNEDKFNEFKELFESYGNALLVGKVLLLYPKEFASKMNKSFEEVLEVLTQDVLAHVLDLVNKKELDEADIKKVLSDVLSGKDILDAVKLEKTDLGDIEEKVLKIIKEKPGLRANAYMGLVMKEFSGKISGGEAMRIIGKFVK